MKEIARLTSNLEARLVEIKRDVNELRAASRENYLTVYDAMKNKYDEFGGIDTLSENGEKLIRSRIKGFFTFIRNRRNISKRTRQDDLILREICCLIEIAAWNCYAGGYKPGVRFKKFLTTYSSCSLFQADYIWLLYRNLVIHVGDLPVKPSFGDFCSPKLHDIFNECMDNFEQECMDKGVDPAPLIYRQMDLFETQIKILKSAKYSLNPADNNLVKEMLALKYI